MTIHQYRVVWTGATGLPGYTLFNFSYPTEPGTAPTIATALDAFCNSIRTALPSVVSIRPETLYKVLDTATGALIDELNDAGTSNSHSGTNAGVYNARAGGCLNLKTGTVVGGRKARGRIFLVPFSGASYTATGVIDSAVISNCVAAADNLRTATSLAPWSVWHRPVLGAGGVAAPITGESMNSESSVLKSRAQ